MALISPLSLKFARPTFPPLDIAGTIYTAIIDSSDNNYIFGSFTTVQGNNRYGRAQLSNNNVLGTFGNTDIGYGTLYAAASAYDFTTSQEVFFVPTSTLNKIKKSDATVVATGTQGFEGLVQGILSDSNNTGVFVRGGFTKVAGIARNTIAKFNQTPTLVTTWSCNPPAGYGITSMVLSRLSSLYIYLTGGFPTIRGVARKYIARVRRDTGAVDTTFNAGALPGFRSIQSCVVCDDDSVVIFGDDSTRLNPTIYRLSSTGAVLWFTGGLSGFFGSGFSDFSFLANINGSDIYVYVTAYTQPGNPATKIGQLVRISTAGVVDTSFGNSGAVTFKQTGANPPAIRDIKVNSAGRIVVVGNFNAIDDAGVSDFARDNYAVLEANGNVVTF